MNKQERFPECCSLTEGVGDQCHNHQSSDLNIGFDSPMYPPLATKKDGQEKQRKMNKEKEGLCYQGDESECSGNAMGSETSFV